MDTRYPYAIEDDRFAPTPARAKFLAGVVAGAIGGILMIGFMMGYAEFKGAGMATPLKGLGAFIYGVEALVAGPEAMLVGALLQLGFAIVLGLFFALFISRGTSIVASVFGGVFLAIVVWAAMQLVVLPLENPTMAARVALIPGAYFCAHLILGLALGLMSVLVRRFSRGAYHLEPVRDRRVGHAAETQSL